MNPQTYDASKKFWVMREDGTRIAVAINEKKERETMNLNELFEIQSGLDYHIVKEKGLEGQDMLSEKILALQVELGECANEWRGFKFWSENQKSNTEALSIAGNKARRYNPLLEEYVDCLHFILSIGLELGADKWISKYTENIGINKAASITDYFLEVKYIFLDLGVGIRKQELEPVAIRIIYATGVDQFLNLGKLLGFTWEQIEQAYLDKNKINHERQNTGY